MDRGRGRGAKRRSRTGAEEFRGDVSEKVAREMKVDDPKEEKSGDEIEQDLAGQRCREMHGEGQG